MRNRLGTLLVLTLVYGISLSLAGVVRAQQGEKERARQALEADAGSQNFDAHDFSGIWEMIRLDQTPGTVPPALTPAGLAAMKGRIGDTPGVPREIVNGATAQLVYQNRRKWRAFQRCGYSATRRVSHADE